MIATVITHMNDPNFAYEKTVEPTHVLTFLGIELDSQNMTMRFPSEKLNLLNSTLTNFCASKECVLERNAVTYWNIKLSKVVAPGRAFCRHLINSTIDITKPYQRIRVTKTSKQISEFGRKIHHAATYRPVGSNLNLPAIIILLGCRGMCWVMNSRRQF